MAQDVELGYSVSGEVVDARSHKQLQYVNISVPGTHFATVTNADGSFTIKSNEQPKHILVSHIGYKSRRVTVDASQREYLRIELQPNTVMLDDVIVTAVDPLEVIHAAIDKIRDNYSDHPELYRCFYRETVQKRSKFIYIAEAVSDMYKTAYRYGNRHDRVAIVKGRRLLSPKQSDTLTVKVIGGPVQPVMLDLVKNRDFLLNQEELNLYSFQMQEAVSIDDRQQFVIQMTPHFVTDYALFYGTIYIDRQTLAFTRIELSLDMSDRAKATRFMLVRKPLGVRFRPKEMSMTVNYTYNEEENSSHISYVRTQFRFNCDWKRRLLATSFTAVNEVVVTDRHDKDITPIPRKESFDDRDSFYDHPYFFDEPDFWRDYNIIEPTESLEHAIGKLLKVNKKAGK